MSNYHPHQRNYSRDIKTFTVTWFQDPKLPTHVRPVRVAMVVGLLLAASSSFGANLTWLYDYETEVTDQSEDQLNRALRAGLETVLTRITGLRHLPDSQALADAFQDLNAYQLQFRYEQGAVSSSGERALTLIIDFDEGAVQNLIREAGLPIWSAQRPHVLLLISIVDRDRRLILNQTMSHPLQTVIESVASRRGVAFSQPLMDLRDMSAVPEGSFEFGFLADGERLVKRLGADLVVTARIDPTPFSKHRVWLSIFGPNGRRSMVFDAADLSTTTEEIVHRLADHLAQRYAVTRSEVAALHLIVQDIRHIGDYKSVLDYLEQWEFIDHVLVRSVQLDRVEFELRTSSTWEQFAIHLDEDQSLLPIPQIDMNANSIPNFTWQGSQ